MEIQIICTPAITFSNFWFWKGTAIEKEILVLLNKHCSSAIEFSIFKNASTFFTHQEFFQPPVQTTRPTKEYLISNLGSSTSKQLFFKEGFLKTILICCR